MKQKRYCVNAEPQWQSWTPGAVKTKRYSGTEILLPFLWFGLRVWKKKEFWSSSNLMSISRFWQRRFWKTKSLDFQLIFIEIKCFLCSGLQRCSQHPRKNFEGRTYLSLAASEQTLFFPFHLETCSHLAFLLEVLLRVLTKAKLFFVSALGLWFWHQCVESSRQFKRWQNKLNDLLRPQSCTVTNTWGWSRGRGETRTTQVALLPWSVLWRTSYIVSFRNIFLFSSEYWLCETSFGGDFTHFFQLQTKFEAVGWL